MKRNKIFVVLSFLLTLLIIGSIVPVMAQSSTLTIWADDTRAPALEALVEEFEAEFGISLVIQELDFGDIRDNFRVAGPAGEGPDIITGASDWVGELVTNGLLAEIDMSGREGDFLPGALQGFQYDGVQYGMLYAIENVALVRNTELVPEAPATWEEVAAISAQLVEEGTTQYGFIESMNDPYHFFAVQSAFGGYVFGLTDTGAYDVTDVGVDSEGAIASGEWLNELVSSGLMPADVDYDIKHTLFGQGDTPMIVTGPWALPVIRDSGVPFEVSALPSGPAGPSTPFIGVQGFMISAFSQNRVLAEAFLLEYVATDEVMQAIYEADPRPSAFVSVNEAIEGDVAGFADAGATGVPIPNIPAMASVWTAWGDATEFIVRQQLSPEEAYTQAAEQIRTLIGDASAPVNTAELTIVEVAASSDNFSILVAAVEAAGLVDALSGDGPFTVLAPTNAAFEALLAELELEAEDLLADTDLLTSVLTYHVIEGEFFAADVADLTAAPTLNGAEIAVSVSEFGVITLNETVEVTQVNIDTLNGVIHVIDGVLLPPN